MMKKNNQTGALESIGYGRRDFITQTALAAARLALAPFAFSACNTQSNSKTISQELLSTTEQAVTGKRKFGSFIEGAAGKVKQLKGKIT